MHGLVGSLFDPNEEEDIPLLYFHSFYSCFKWLCSWMIPGLGMFSEAYFIFSIGNIKPILSKQYPRCWNKPYTVRLNPFVEVILYCHFTSNLSYVAGMRQVYPMLPVCIEVVLACLKLGCFRLCISCLCDLIVSV